MHSLGYRIGAALYGALAMIGLFTIVGLFSVTGPPFPLRNQLISALAASIAVQSFLAFMERRPPRNS